MNCPYCGSKDYRYKSVTNAEYSFKFAMVNRHCVCKDCNQDFVERSIYNVDIVTTVRMEDFNKENE